METRKPYQPAACGHRVYGVELSGAAAAEFFAESGMPRSVASADRPPGGPAESWAGAKVEGGVGGAGFILRHTRLCSHQFFSGNFSGKPVELLLSIQAKLND